MDKIEPKYLQAVELIKKAIHPCAWKGHSGKYLDDAIDAYLQ